MDNDFLSSLHPVFRLKDVCILWSGNVYKIGQTNCLNPRLLVIASPGIFLIRKKPFTFQSRIITSISFFDLVSLHVTEQDVSFSSKQSQIRVKLQNAKEIVSLVVFIRQAQFPTDVLPLNFSFVNEEMANLCTPAQLPYQPASLFLDRTLSCICHFDIIPSDSLISEIPTQFFRKYTITKEMLQTPLLPAWILSLSYDRDVEIIHFDSIKLSDFLDQSQYLFSCNKFVKTVEFEKVDFTNSEQKLTNLFKNPHRFKPINWVFIDCDLTNQNFSKFFNSISFIDKKISEIQFTKCTFSESIFLDTFQSIFFNDCFHSIQSFQFNSNLIKTDSNSMIYDIFLSQISEILCCSWVLQQKCLSKLSLNSTKIGDMSPILSQIFTFDTGLKYISIDDNDFLLPLKINDENESSKNSILVSFISFRKSRLSKSFVLSLISLIKKEKVVFVGIDLSQIEIVNDDGSSIINTEKKLNDDAEKLLKNEIEIKDQIQDLNDNEIENKNINDVEIKINKEKENQNKDQIENKNENESKDDNLNENNCLNLNDSIDKNQQEVFEQNSDSACQQNKENCLDFLLNELQNVSMPSLEVFFFDENVMNSSQTIQFVNFLKNQPNLKNISVNCSIDVSDSPFGLLSFFDFCHHQNILSLSIRGDSDKSIKFSYGLMNLNLIRKAQSIECLDISNSKIGQEGLELLLPLITDGKLKEIYFDGSNVNSFQFLCKFCTTILKSKIKYASFPENDFQRILNSDKNPNCISLVSIDAKDGEDFVSSVEILKDHFHSLFYFVEYNCTSTIRNKALKINNKKLSYGQNMPNRTISQSNENLVLLNKAKEINPERNASLNCDANIVDESKIIVNCIFNHKTRDSYNECVENSNIEPSETIVSLVRNIQDSLSFDNLFNSL